MQKLKQNKREKYFINKSQISLGFTVRWVALHFHVAGLSGSPLQKINRTTKSHHYLKWNREQI